MVFAGEAISTDFPATLQGAYGSGDEAAKTILAMAI
jgi:monoamine oxidase